MKELDFKPAKSKTDFRQNYKLHDLAEWNGKNLLTQWGIKFADFGEDKRFHKVWEKGGDKPDTVLESNNKIAFIDWKGKSKPFWIINKRAYKSYIQWSEKHNAPVFIAFFVFDERKKILEKRIGSLINHKTQLVEKKQWDKNDTIKFTEELPEFNRVNLISLWRTFYE
ncbi:MAG: hypothetical protein K9J12_04355 [Melioribacteraceae bacterium]|nr:hypothetical protein [Melioribacteraceae bacterium]MCF8265104.1 hypothetical protein [Melioribacteraceae bacterium]MCF8413223.1 hypothetical protein [Melioribacteraceae bacterium]MCF8431190.1 hypothetical protein [Melioribacteraceae bacterium]